MLIHFSLSIGPVVGGFFFLFHYYFQARSGSRIYWRVIDRILVNTRRLSLVLDLYFNKLASKLNSFYCEMWDTITITTTPHPPSNQKKITNFFKLKSLFAFRWFHDSDLWYVYELQRFEQTFTQKGFPWHSIWTHQFTLYNLYICKMNSCCSEFQ